MADPDPGHANGANSSIEALYNNLRRQSSTTGSPAGTTASQQFTFPEQFGISSPTSLANSTPPAVGGSQYFPPSRTSQVSSYTESPFHPNSSSPIYSSSIHGTSAQLGSAQASSHVSTPQGIMLSSNAEQTANLFNLLKLNQSTKPDSRETYRPGQEANKPGSNGVAKAQAQNDESSHGRAVSASDLVASFMGKSFEQSASKDSAGLNPLQQSNISTPPSYTAQSSLLSLLNRPKPDSSKDSSNPLPGFNFENKVPADPLNEASKIGETYIPNSGIKAGMNKSFQSDESSAPSKHQISESSGSSSHAVPTSMFTYRNPFEDLAASSPRNRTPKNDGKDSSFAAPKFEILRPSKEQFPPTSSKEEVDKSGAESFRGPNDSLRTKSNDSIAQGTHYTARTLPSQPSQSSPPPPEVLAEMEALTHGKAAEKDSESVAEAVKDISADVDKQIEDAFSREDKLHQKASNTESSKLLNESAKQLHHDAQKAAVMLSAELEKSENEGALEEAYPPAVANAVKNVLDEAAQRAAADSWESDGGETTDNKENGRVVQVFNLPMKPFASISLSAFPDNLRSKFPEDCLMDIARLKKDFDQIDRSLVTASNQFIAYGVSKNGGVRIIRQDDGLAKHIFRNTHDRIFNVAIASTSVADTTAETEAIMGTSVNGAVYWAPLTRGDTKFYEDEEIEDYGFIFPPVISTEESSTGVQLKTRARKSSRHADYFAIGRGKVIHIIFPHVACSSAYLRGDKRRSVNVQKYIDERSLKIFTHKAGKDFTFSEDDSTIASLDKSGKLQIWDIRKLVAPANGEIHDDTNSRIEPIEIRNPLMSFTTVSVNEKAWPTSVQFVDKVRPYTKGGALRYLLIGSKQNHTLQLWDLGLGKAVQELNLPHNKESDAICSVVFHPASGFVIIGHPTRNSIYLVHLSAPKYNVPSMTQAEYIEKLVKGGTTLGQPDSTAILSGLREYSFAAKGDLRSLDILSTFSEGKDADTLMFELYAMHSKGITCISVRREDLGWDENNKVKHPVDAQREGIITVSTLREFVQAPSSTTNGAKAADTPFEPATPSKSKVEPKHTAKKTPLSTPEPQRSNSAETGAADVFSATITKPEDGVDKARLSAVNGDQDGSSVAEKNEKPEKKKKKKSTSSSSRGNDQVRLVSSGKDLASSDDATRNKEENIVDPRESALVQGLKSLSVVPGGSSRSVPEDQSVVAQPKPEISNSLKSSGIGANDIKQIEKSVFDVFKNVLSRELDRLGRRLDDEKRVLQASGDAKQDVILRLVAKTLSENVEQTLHRIVQASIEQKVVPSLADITVKSLKRSTTDALSHQLTQVVPREINAALPNLVLSALQTPEVSLAISDRVSKQISGSQHVEMIKLVKQTVMPALEGAVATAAQRSAANMALQANEVARLANAQRERDSEKIDRLTNMVDSLAGMVKSMSVSQKELQTQLQHMRHEKQGASSADESGTQSRDSQPPSQLTPEQSEYEHIAELIRRGNNDEAILRWLSSSQQQNLFDHLMFRIRPEALRNMAPLLALSVGAAVTLRLHARTTERLAWLEVVYQILRTNDPEIAEVLPGVADAIIQRLESLYMRIAEDHDQDPLLKKIIGLTKTARELGGVSR